MADTPAIAAIKRSASKYGLDWRTLAAVAHYESGLDPHAKGDGGHAFGLFQLNNAGGTITGDPNPGRYYNPQVNADFAARAIARLGISKLPANQQIAQIVQRFERPAAPGKEIAGAQSWFAQNFGGGQHSLASAPVGSAVGSVGAMQPGGDPVRSNQSSLLAYLLSASAAPSLLGTPQAFLSFLTSQSAPTAATPAARPAGPQTGSQAPLGGSQAGTFGYPLGKRGKIIGTPYQGTHGKGFNAHGGSDNWESENAVDISVPVNTPVYAVADGVIGNQIGSLGSGGRFAGQRVHLQTGGNEFYYAHLSRLNVKAGERVRKGQLIGWSGAANGVAHLHLASAKGNPDNLFGG